MNKKIIKHIGQYWLSFAEKSIDLNPLCAYKGAINASK